ncbi:NAD(P)-dependent oxidoreductase [Pararhizobium mangrovi]|uniref:NAD(P)-dependent oxidoreductase n=1 Tax=Pararhizobium mangrovi TaxID=2590452 RepID=A0A506TZ06_9HYPH|nr:NAD(P)-dependent oxidoreductase [Pararhizobium mangrovi]TPW26221.1 NAD(P)-dependent oxidoreductase [Pararhizobium mangrovi]
MARIAFLGLGAMGARMAANFLAAGHTLTVWNRTSERTEPLVEKGASAMETPRAAVEGADFVMAMVRDDAASEAVWCDAETGALAGMKAGAVAVESSTVSLEWAHKLARAAGDRGVAFADAPVSGSLPQAESGDLVYLVGADDGAFTALEPVLAAAGKTVRHCGPVGAGASMKLAINLMLGVQGAAMAEALALAEKQGVALETAVDIIASTPVCSPVAKGAAGLMAKGDFSPLFPVSLMEKDFGLIDAAARASGAKTPISAAVRTVYRDGVDAGLAEENYPAIVKLFRT